MALPGSPITLAIQQFFDNQGNPLAGGKLFAYVAGTSTPKDTYFDADLDPSHANTNPVIMDAAGRCVVYLTNDTGYKFILTDSDNVQIWSQDDDENVAEVQLAGFSTALAGGSKGVTSGYTITNTDQLVTVSSSGGPNPCIINLPAATAAPPYPLTIKNVGTIPLAVTPNGSDSIDTLTTAFAVAAASSPTFPSILLVSDNVSAWYIQASHGL